MYLKFGYKDDFLYRTRRISNIYFFHPVFGLWYVMLNSRLLTCSKEKKKTCILFVYCFVD